MQFSARMGREMEANGSKVLKHSFRDVLFKQSLFIAHLLSNSPRKKYLKVTDALKKCGNKFTTDLKYKNQILL